MAEPKDQRGKRENGKTAKIVVISIANIYRAFTICHVQCQALTFIVSFSVFDDIVHWGYHFPHFTNEDTEAERS